MQESVYGRLVGKLKTRLTHFRVGDSLDKSTDMGAIVDESQKKSIDEYVEDARREGAEVTYIINTHCVKSKVTLCTLLLEVEWWGRGLIFI